MTLEKLVTESLQIYRVTKETTVPVTKPSIPILYFGDRISYEKSARKVITVGLNPSHSEFPVEDRFLRFRKAEEISTSLDPDQNDVRLYLDSLNEYYKNEPYKWFGCYEPILNGLASSYYENEYPYRALHTDICSPLATDITWSRLDDIHQKRLGYDGNRIWHSLVEVLTPDVIIISVARRHLEKMRFKRTRWYESIRITKDKYGAPRNNPYLVSTSPYTLNGKKGLLVFGKAANIPFGLISNIQKLELGHRLLDLM